MKKKLYLALASLAIFACFWIYPLIWGKPRSFHFFVDRAMFEMTLSDPELLSNLGLLDGTPLDFFSGHLTDISHEKGEKNLKHIQKLSSTLHRYEKERLSYQEKLTFDILDHFLENILESASFGYGSYESISSLFNPYPVNQLFGIQSSLPEFMVNIHRVTNKKSALRYISRLSEWEKKFNDLIEDLKFREKKGVILPSFLIEKVLSELESFIQVPPAKNILFTALEAKLEKAKLSSKMKTRIEGEALKAIESTVYPAYLQLIGFLEKQKARATQDAGVWKFPNGDAYYAASLRFHTTTSDTPDAVHALGLSEVARIQKEMRNILDKIGYEGVKINEAMRSLAKDPRFRYPDTEEGRRQILADFYRIFDRLQAKLPELFKHLPSADLKIEAVPEFKAKTAPFAYYEPGDFKGVRPGVFYANVQDIETYPTYTMPALAYHEGLPGHHLQISLAQEIPNLPMLRRMPLFNAYVEGWGLYAEQLGSEFGFMARPEDELGKLQLELQRAVRLVVDTGLHHKRWSREEAIQYMTETTGLSARDIEIEVDRYMVMPGQACSYKIGMIKIMELREKMKAYRGANFDIREFHDLILGNGAMPLYILDHYMMESFSAGFEPAA